MNKERFQLSENLRSAHCLPFVISKVLAARMRKLITARARKNKRTARMLANACKDHWIPLQWSKSCGQSFTTVMTAEILAHSLANFQTHGQTHEFNLCDVDATVVSGQFDNLS